MSEITNLENSWVLIYAVILIGRAAAIVLLARKVQIFAFTFFSQVKKKDAEESGALYSEKDWRD